MKNKQKLVFFGSPIFSAKILEKLHSRSDELNIDVCLVITQPDRPAGRGMILAPTPVKIAANKAGIEVFEYSKENRIKLAEIIRKLKPKYGTLYAFNEIIKESILEIFPLGLWNIHPSLLPLYRGPSPVAYPLMLGEKETGVTIMKMDKGLDTGPVLAQTRHKIGNNINHEQLIDILSEKGFNLLHSLLINNNYQEKTQDNKLATYTQKIKRDDGYIDLTSLISLLNSQKIPVENIPIIHSYYENNKNTHTPPQYIYPEDLANLAKGLSPWPGIWTRAEINGTKVRIKFYDITYNFMSKSLKIESVQVEGKERVNFSQWNSYYKIFPA